MITGRELGLLDGPCSGKPEHVAPGPASVPNGLLRLEVTSPLGTLVPQLLNTQFVKFWGILGESRC